MEPLEKKVDVDVKMGKGVLSGDSKKTKFKICQYMNIWCQLMAAGPGPFDVVLVNTAAGVPRLNTELPPMDPVSLHAALVCTVSLIVLFCTIA